MNLLVNIPLANFHLLVFGQRAQRQPIWEAWCIQTLAPPTLKMSQLELSLVEQFNQKHPMDVFLQSCLSDIQKEIYIFSRTRAPIMLFKNFLVNPFRDVKKSTNSAEFVMRVGPGVMGLREKPQPFDPVCHYLFAGPAPACGVTVALTGPQCTPCPLGLNWQIRAQMGQWPVNHSPMIHCPLLPLSSSPKDLPFRRTSGRFKIGLHGVSGGVRCAISVYYRAKQVWFAVTLVTMTLWLFECNLFLVVN